MTSFKFNDLKFIDEKDRVKAVFLGLYYFYLDPDDLKRLGDYSVKEGVISFKSQKKDTNLAQKFNFLLGKGFENLKNSMNDKPTLYVHENSNIPLIGSNSFGIVDRGTNTIEVKPFTSCNIDCIFCSVDHTKRIRDIVVEPGYLVKELKRVISLKNNRVSIHIGGQGDPSIYGGLEYMVEEIGKIGKVYAISMVTNAMALSKKKVDRLIKAGMTHFHISLHSTDQEEAERLANARYDVKHVMGLCRHISGKAKLLLVPVWLPGMNDQGVEEVIKFSKEIGANIGIQNFLEYKLGKKPVNPLPMKLFYQKLHALEDKLGVDLTTLQGDLQIVPDTVLEKPFKKGDIIDVEIFAEERLKNSRIAAARGRAVTVINCLKDSGRQKVRIISDKDNIFMATPVA